MREMKSFPYAVKAINDRTVVGIASVFGNVDDVGDIIWPGAYQKTIQEQARRIKHLWMHDPFSPPIASIDELKEVGRDDLPKQVLQAAPNALGGLQVTRTYFTTARAEEVFQAIKAEAINELSIGYDSIKFDFNEVDGQRVRNLRELRLFDTSDVTWGANGATANFAKLAALPGDLLLKRLEEYLAEMKAGARHSSKDVEMLNSIHRMVVDLGATTCKGIAGEGEEEETGDQAGEKSRAGEAQYPLTLLKQRLSLLDLSV